MYVFAVLVALGFSGGEPLCIEQQADWCELNRVVSIEKTEEGIPYYKVTLVQVVFWRGSGRDECLGWKLADTIRFISEGKGVACVWHDGDTLRKVRAKFLIESVTLGDPELASRELLPADHRRGLGGKPGEVTYRSWKQMRMKNP